MSLAKWEQASNGPPTRVLYGQLPDEPRGSLVAHTKILGLNEETAPCESQPVAPLARLCLFKLNMSTDGSLAATIKFKRLEANTDIASGFYMGYSIPDSEILFYIHGETIDTPPNQVQDKTIIVSLPTTDSRLVEFGVYCQGSIEDPEPLALCQILNLTIKQKSQRESSWFINGVRVMERGIHPNCDKRVAWNWSGSGDTDLACLPWSKTTGPFSYFDVMLGGEELGRAYCTEFPVRGEDFDGCEAGGLEVVIRGYLFGGGEVASLPLWLSRDTVGVL